MKNTPSIHWLFPLFLVLYEISVYLSNDMYLPALPNMMQDLGVSSVKVQWTITMWFIGATCTPLLIGVFADRFGRRPILLMGGVIYVLASALCALASNEYTLLLSRLLQGAMLSSMSVAGYACIHESYEHKEAIRILAIMGSISVLAPALGPLLGAWVLLFSSWRSIFWIIVIMATITLMGLYRHMPETLAIASRQPLNFNTIMSSYWRVITNKRFFLLTMVLGLTFAGFISWITTGPLLIIEHLHYSATAYGWMQCAVFLAYILGSHLVTFLLKKREAYRLINVGLLVSFVAGLLLLMGSFFFPNQFYLFVCAMIFYSFGSALAFSPLNRLIIESSTEPMGIRSATITVCLMAFSVLGSAAVSLIFNGSSFSLAIVIAACISIACYIVIASNDLRRYTKSNASRADN